jgi:DNA repair protein RecO (recombination protein O)
VSIAHDGKKLWIPPARVKRSLVAISAVLDYDGIVPASSFRTVRSAVIVLHRSRWGECHKLLTFLTPERGLLRATAFGAYKGRSRLGMASEPFVHSTVHLYHNPVRDTFKVVEMEVRDGFDGLRGDLGKFYAASLWAEICLKSLAVGETTPDLFQLLLECLRTLEKNSDEGYLSLQFLWRFLGLAGYQPGLSHCERCGRPLEEGAVETWSPNGMGLVCGRCRDAGSLAAPAGCRRYLAASQGLPLAAAAAIRMEKESFAALRRLLLSAVEGVLESGLKSLETAGDPA